MTVRVAQVRPYAIAESLRRFWHWWSEELTDCIPRRARRAWSTEPYIVRIVVDGDYAEIHEKRSRASISAPSTILDRGSWSDLRSRGFAKIKRKAFRTVELVVPTKSCLVIRRTLPRSALPRAYQIAAIDAFQNSPFTRDEVYVGCEIAARHATADDKITALLIIAKKEPIDALIGDLNSHGIRTNAVRAGTAKETEFRSNLIAGTPAQRRSVDQMLSICIGGLLALTALLLPLSIYALEARQLRTLSDLQQEIAAYREKVDSIRMERERADLEISGAERLKAAKIASVSLTEVWEEVSRILPEHAWITSLRLEENVLHLDGLARSAAELVALFDRSSLFSGVQLYAQVTREEQSGLERYQMRLVVAREANSAELTMPSGTGNDTRREP